MSRLIFGRKEGNVLFDAFNTFYLRLYGIGHMVMDYREETCCNHYIGYSFSITARDLLYTPSQRENSMYHSLYYTSHGALTRTRNRSVSPPWGIDPKTHHIISRCSTTELNLAPRLILGVQHYPHPFSVLSVVIHTFISSTFWNSFTSESCKSRMKLSTNPAGGSCGDITTYK